MAFEWYASDDATAAGTAYTLTTAAGTPSTAIEVHAWLNKGSTVGSAETRYLRLEVLDGGVWKSSGLDTLDRREFEIRIIGSQNPDAVPGFSVATTAWIPVGSMKTFPPQTWYPNCCVEFEVRVNPGLEGGSSSPATFRIRAVQGAGQSPVSIPDDVSVDGPLDFQGEILSNVLISGTLSADLDAGGFTVTGLGAPALATDAARLGDTLARPAKGPARLVATTDLTFPTAVTNGDFATDLAGWGAGSGWSWSSGTALHTAGSTDAFSQDFTAIAGVSYRITVTVTGTAGTLTPNVGPTSGTPIAAGAGVVTQVIVAPSSGTLWIGFTPTTDFDGAIDDVLVEPLNVGLVAIDSVTPDAADVVLLTAGPLPGKWIASAGAWTRHPDCLDATYLYPGCSVWVTDGTVELHSDWVQYGTFASQLWAKRYQVP